MATPFQLENFINMLNNWGITDVLLPFLLVFTIVYAVLQKAKIFGEEKKNFNVIIALVLGLSVVIPHVTGTYPPGADIVVMINTVLPHISLIAIAFIMLLILVGIFGGQWISTALSGWMALISVVAVVIIFGGAAGWWDESRWLFDFFGEDAIAFLVMILVFGAIIWFITREKKTAGTTVTNWAKSVGDFLAGK